MNKKTAGISLVALVITIIVLIILTGSVIMTFMDGGIIDRAREAVFKNDIKTYQEMLAVKNAERQIKISTGNGEDIPEITIADIPDFKEEYKDLITIANGEFVLISEDIEEPYITWLTDLGIGLGKGASNTSKITDWDYYIKGTDVILTKYKGGATKVVVPATYYLEKDTYYEGNTEGTYNVKIQPNTSAIDWQTTYEMEEDGGLFAGNTKITSVEFEPGVKLMDDCWGLIPYMFANCTALETVKNSPSIYDECYSPFKNCPSLKEIVLLADIEYLEYRVYNILSGCGASKVTIHAPAGSPYFGETYTVGDTTVRIGPEVEKSNFIKGVDGWEAYITGTDIVLTKYIGTETEVYVPATYYLESDAYYVPITAGTYNVKIQPNNTASPSSPAVETGGLFANNTNITSVEFAVGVELIEDCWGLMTYMFANCTSLATIKNIPPISDTWAYETNMNGDYPFKGCSSLTEITLVNDTVLGVAQYLFSGCTSSAVTVKVPASSSYVNQTIQAGNTTLTVQGY